MAFEAVRPNRIGEALYVHEMEKLGWVDATEAMAVIDTVYAARVMMDGQEEKKDVQVQVGFYPSFKDRFTHTIGVMDKFIGEPSPIEATLVVANSQRRLEDAQLIEKMYGLKIKASAERGGLAKLDVSGEANGLCFNVARVVYGYEDNPDYKVPLKDSSNRWLLDCGSYPVKAKKADNVSFEIEVDRRVDNNNSIRMGLVVVTVPIKENPDKVKTQVARRVDEPRRLTTDMIESPGALWIQQNISE